jgi:hypothetical protein
MPLRVLIGSKADTMHSIRGVRFTPESYRGRASHVRFGSLAAAQPNQRRGCFTPESGHEHSKTAFHFGPKADLTGIGFFNVALGVSPAQSSHCRRDTGSRGTADAAWST